VTQPVSFREQIKNLEHVQELDLKIDQIKKNRDALPVALKELDQSLLRVRTTVDTKKKALEEIEKTIRQTKAALELNNDRLTRSNARLEQVQNTQEFQAIQKELEQLRKMTLSLEDQIKKSTVDLDNGNKDLTTLSAQQETVHAEREAKASTVAGQTTEFDTQIGELMTERKKYSTNVDVRILAQYDRVRVARAGLGFVPAVAGRCKGCNMVVPPQLYNEIQRGNTAHQCPSCHRILFVPMASASGSPSSEASKA
jgi:predicted  nucleic acid-binding Zn-ribbon protein